MGLTKFPHGILATPNLGGGGIDLAPEAFGGKTYFVDYEHGSDSNDGSIDHPVKQVNQAITLSNNHKNSESMASGDLGYYRRNRIYIRPFGAAATSEGLYDPITVIPQHCDIIGVGAAPRSSGGGIVSIGSLTDATTAFTVGSAGMRGVNFYNIKFQGGGTSTYVFTATGNIFRCGWYNCGFYVNSASTGHMTVAAFCGSVMQRCQFGHNLSTAPTICFNVSGQFTDNWFEENAFCFGTTGAVVIGTTGLSHSTVFYHNFFMTYGGSTVQFHDNSTDSGVFLAENYFSSAMTDAIERVAHTQDAGNVQGENLLASS